MSEMAQGGSSIVWSVSDGSLHKILPVYVTTDCMDIDCNLTATDRGREPLLPPCCVCGEKASGFHYGANTCEACKTFFRRSQSRKVVYTCGYNGECVIGPTRKRCSACRLDKCLAMGMAKTAIKTGRYTSEKRTAVIKEVNRLKVLRLMNNEGVSCRMTLEGTSKLDNIVEQLTNFFLDECARRVTFSDGGYKKEQLFLERRALENQMFDGLRNIPNEEYKEVVQMTGMDIDGRQKLLSRYVPSCEKLLQYFTSFCKQVPGFNRMSYEDQKSLMKGSSLDCMCLQFSHLYNVEEGTCLLPYADDLVYSQDEVICLYNNKEDQLQVWEMFKRVQMLDLTVDERALAGAIVLMNANAELSETGRRIASISTDFLIQVLLHLFDKNHDKEERTFTRLMSILTELRTRTLLMLKVQMCVNENSVDWNIPKSNIFRDFFPPNSEH